MHLLQIVGAAGSSGKSEIGILRAAQIIGDDVLVELANQLAVEPIVQGMVRRAPTDQHIVPLAIFDIAVTDRDLVGDAADCRGHAGIEEVSVIGGHVAEIGVLPSVEGNAEAVLDPDRTVAAAIAPRACAPRGSFCSTNARPSAPLALLPR